MVEFAFVAVLLVMLVFGIVVFGLLLSFKQDVTRAAAEGARVAAVAQPPLAQPATADVDARHVAAVAATEEAVDSFGQSCGVDGMDCNITVHNCGDITAATPTDYWDDGDDDCVTVELVYDYDNFPLILDPPIISATLPDRISSSSVARLNQ